MKRRTLILSSTMPLLAALPGCAHGPDPLPVVSAGRIERLAAFPSRHVEARHVDVCLPPGYDGTKRHPVIYMHDGQALFDGAQSMSKTGWRVDEAIAGLIAQGVELPLVVGIWNIGTRRHGEYFPQPMLDKLPAAARERAWDKLPLQMQPMLSGLLKDGRSSSEAYLRFITQELKPAVDARFATKRGRESTFLMGSSMGGLISIHGLLAYPQVFGAAASLSTHWIGLLERNDDISDAALAWLRESLPPAGRLRLYLDRGTAGGDAEYAHAQGQVDALLRERSLVAPLVVSRVFEGAEHTERYWAQRVHVPFGFLLTPGAVA